MKRTLASLIIGLSLLMGATTSAWAQDFKKGYEAFNKGNYAYAMLQMRPLAERGNEYAQFMMGVMYADGLGVIQDFKEAAKMFGLAAQKGLISAQFNLGAFYEEGKGVAQDYKMAVKWYRLAAEQGHASGQTNLGAMYANGKGVIRDNVMAHMWLIIGASNGSPSAPKNRDIIAKRLTAAEISKSQQLARECVARQYKDC